MAPVSAIITTYNRCEFVQRAIDSVLAQHEPVAELLVVDDGSSDGTGERLRRYGSSIQYLRQANRGQAAAINYAVSKARQPLLAFLDSDDLWRPEKIEKQWRYLGEDAECGGVYGYGVRKGGAVSPAGPEPMLLPSMLMVRSDIWFDVGALDERLRVGAFIDWHARAMDAGIRLQVLPHLVAEKGVHGDGHQGELSAVNKQHYLEMVRGVLARRRAKKETMDVE